jgi:hypothetical protein
MTSGTSSIAIRFDALEIARGHDGLLAGSPEPVVLVGVLSCGDGRAILRARHIFRFQTPRSLPITLRVRDPARLACSCDAGERSFAVVVIGLEADSGSDVGRLYGALERPERFSAWPEGEALPDPQPLERCGDPHPRVPTPVQLLADGENLERMADDDWVGACVIAVPAHERWTSDVRFSLLSPDRSNDWTARARIKVHVPL